MKTILLAALFALLAPVSLKADTHLFILSGQSNMARLKPETAFTPAVEKALGKENVAVIKEATGGQPISRWYQGPKTGDGKTGDFYKNILTKVETATAGKTIKSITFVWMQGERDAQQGMADTYSDNLTGLIAKLRKDLKHQDMNVVIGRLSDFAMDKPGWISVRETQVKIAEADPRAVWVDTDDLNDLKKKGGAVVNDLHLSKEGYVTLGERFAEKALELIKKKP
jgi:hypothetical protein